MITLISCGRCKSKWTGAVRSHCGGCHRTFAGITAFDAHQQNTEPGITCADPAERGMIAVEKSWGIMWSLGTNPSGRLEDE